MARGMFWGLGHTVSLFTICSVVILFGAVISNRLQASFEFTVGLMIIFLGLQTLWRMHRDRLHAHVHEHDGVRHLHLHSHKGEALPHAEARHDHKHRRTNLKAVLIGLMHGTAGSGALLVMALAATQSIRQTLLYFAVFGVGSMVGMATVSAVASVPLGLAQRGATWLRQGVSVGIGAVALWIGGTIALHNAALLNLI